jgi:hypothetical protein
MNKEIWILSLGLVLAFTLLITAGLALTRQECVSRAEVMGMPYSWSPLQGCMVQVENHWVPLNSVRKFINE